MEKHTKKLSLPTHYVCSYDSPLGSLLLESDGEALVGLWFGEKRYFPNAVKAEKELPVFRETKEWLNLYFQGREPDFMPKLRLSGTEFRMEIWQMLMQIPYGKTVTYGELAKAVAKKRKIKSMSAQAVGGAVGHNPISILVPCHRVMGVNHNLVGYGGGLHNKIALLQLEKAL
ncbi:MAG: methylated-DNA--[protein]-cysteine S-methyltransferase [Eubacteriales bacterium]|nr:methylated-DNA--[protein]-cysteine S-methyltransferase [Eubacteriales bacterium]